MRQVSDRGARDRRVGRDHAVDAVAHERCSNQPNLRLVEVGRDLHEHRYHAAVPRRQRCLALLQRREQHVQRCVVLQGAQVLSVRAGDVDGDIVGVRVHTVQAQQVVVGGAFDRRARVLADVEAEHAALAAKTGTLHVRQEGVQPVVVEAQPVDQCPRFRQPVHARLGIARLRLRRHGADLDETETHRTQSVDAAAILVQAGRQSDAVRKPQPGHRDRVIDACLRHDAHQRRMLNACQRAQRQVMGLFGIEPEQERAGQGVGEQRHAGTIRAALSFAARARWAG